MAHADARVRATSLAASAALLGFTVIAAMAMSFSMIRYDAPLVNARPVEIVRPEPDPPPMPDVAAPRVLQELALGPINMEASALPETPVFAAPSLFTAVEPPLISNPRWLQRPRNLARYYPSRALALGVEGAVVLECAVTEQGALRCAVIEETPTNWGFAEAALRISREHVMAPAMRDGRPVEGRYRMRVPFQVQ